MMKRSIILAVLAGLAALNTACAEEADPPESVSAPAESSVAKDAAPAGENTVVAKNTPAAGAAAPKSAGAAARESGSTRSTVQLMATPYRDAKPAGQLPANTAVDILERRGGWLRISAQGKTGWAKLHQVRVGEGPGARKSGEGLAILKNVGQTGRSGSQGIVATTGIRGMSAEELKNAQPNPAAVKTVEGYRVSAGQAREYARSAGLKETSVPALPQPE